MAVSQYAASVDRIQDSTFRKQMQGALWSIAVDILNNAQETTPRKTWAKDRMKENAAAPETLNFFGRYCMANATIAADPKPNDTDVKFVITAAVNDYIAAFA